MEAAAEARGAAAGARISTLSAGEGAVGLLNPVMAPITPLPEDREVTSVAGTEATKATKGTMARLANVPEEGAGRAALQHWS